MYKQNEKYTHIMEYYPPLKEKEILTHASVGMKLEGLMVSELSQSQKDKHHRIPLPSSTYIIKFIETEGRVMAARDQRQAAVWGCCSMDIEVQFFKKEKVLKAGFTAT